ncbi:NAD(P)-binding protein [Xylariaceae sp. FL0804]|nr:NAD(P)-binding protein [Xylariaceae sp. FL0804]
MPKILILGGAGYLGQAVGQALLRSGNHSVFATTRSADKVKELVANETTAIQGNAGDGKFLRDTIAKHHIDVVIDTTQAYGDASTILESIVQAGRDRGAALAMDGSIGPKIGFIYTSGAWVHGSPSRRISDLTVPGTSLAPSAPAKAVSWRPAHEQAILAARDVLDVAVLRPGTIYGRGSWVLGVWLGPLLSAASASASADDAPIDIPVGEHARGGFVHVDDVAAAYAAAVDRLDGRLGGWPVIDVVAEKVAVRPILDAAAKALGMPEGREVRCAGTSGDVFLEATGLAANSDGARARTVLSWEPRRRDFLQNIEITVAAWASTEGASGGS